MEDFIVIIFWIIAGIIWVIQKLVIKKDDEPIDYGELFENEASYPDYQEAEAARQSTDQTYQYDDYENIDYDHEFEHVVYEDAKNAPVEDQANAYDKDKKDVYQKSPKRKKKRSLKNKAELRRAIIMREILDQPRAYET